MISAETKVGLFVLTALALAVAGILKVTDVSFAKRYTLNFIFSDVKGLQKQSPIKIAGVEIGKVERVELEDGHARVVGKIQKEVKIFADAQAKVKVTGLIGSQFLDVKPGTPGARRLEDGDTLFGAASPSLEDLIDRVTEMIDGKNGQPGLSENLGKTVSNMRNITDTLNEAIGHQRSEIKNMVLNFYDISTELKGMTSDLHQITSGSKADIQAAVVKLRSVLERVDVLVAKVQSGEGPVGKLIADKEMGEDVKKTVTNIKETSESAKEILGRFTKIRSYWEFGLRYSPAAQAWRGEGFIRLQPRPDKYYLLGVSNAGDRKHEYENERDYEKYNTITAVIGKEFGPLTVELGAIRSSAGVGLKYFPFNKVADNSPGRWAKKIELQAQAFEFGRNEVRGRQGRERTFKGPQYNVGFLYPVNRWVKVGLNYEDIAEVSQVNLRTHVTFEDRDLAYLFGFVSFAR